METNKLVDAKGNAYHSGLKALVVYFEYEFPDPKNVIQKGLPITKYDQIDIRKLDEIKEKYDIIAAVNSLQCVKANEVPATIQKMASLLNLKGELWVAVPSFEWAAAQVNAVAPDPMIHLMVCGSDNAPHRAIFTLQWLRLLMEQTHLTTQRAMPEQYQIPIGKEKVNVVRNMVIGKKYDEFDAASAIDNPDPLQQLHPK